ncbi:substrate-binding domain-containing protein [Intestinibacter sp.]
MKKLITVIICSLVVFTLTACSNSNKTTENSANQKIGIFMPTKQLQRWNQDGHNLQSELEEKGYKVDLHYAENNSSIQKSQIKEAIEDDYDALIIAAVDSHSLSDALSKAKEKDIKVVAYDRLIMNTDAVSCYATFDNYKVGQIQGQYIVDNLGLAEGKGPYNLEVFGGPVEDNNSYYLMTGAMDKLKVYVDSGQLVIQSGKSDIKDVATAEWSTKNAQRHMSHLLSSTYSDKKIDAVLCANDSIALGVINAFEDADYNTDKLPIITGQDCDIESIKDIIDGTQSMSVFKDTRVLAEQVATMLEQLFNGEEVNSNDDKSYDNGNGVVPTYLCTPGFVDKDNYKKIIIDTGYYTEEELK